MIFKSVSLFYKFFFIISFFISFCSVSYGQDTTSSAQKQALSYYKLEIGMHILDCPVLPNRLKEKVLAIKGVKDYTVDMKSESIFFNVPDGVISIEQIKNMATASDFPPTSINILQGNKPFAK